MHKLTVMVYTSHGKHIESYTFARGERLSMESLAESPTQELLTFISGLKVLHPITGCLFVPRVMKDE